MGFIDKNESELYERLVNPGGLTNAELRNAGANVAAKPKATTVQEVTQQGDRGSRIKRGSTNIPTGVPVVYPESIFDLKKVIAVEKPSSPAPVTKKPDTSRAGGTSANPNTEFPGVGERPVPVPEEWTADTKQREVPCPVCTGSILIKYAGRVFSRICGWIGKAFNINADIIETVKDYVIERLPRSKRSLFKNGGCDACDGKGTIVDVTDDRAKYVQAANIAKNYAKEIEENEAKLGTGGNEYKIVSGHVVHEVGLGMNDVPSYRQEPDKGACNSGFDVAGSKLDPSAPAMLTGDKKCVTVGINPIASPGGQYTIKCSNKFALLAGALGVEITTGGPVTIKGGITQITGPEISIGTQTGTLGLEGEVVNIVASKSVEVGPGRGGKGQFVVKGSGGCTAQWTVGGHLHAESASVVKLETVGRNEPSKVSATTNLYNGPAFWGGQSKEGLQAALKELLAYVLTHVTNPELAKHLASPRYYDSLEDNTVNIAYMTLQQEPVQTGWAIIGPGTIAGISSPLKIPVYNFPHIHAQFDQDHYHETRVPDIDCTSESAKELRTKVIAQGSPAPSHRKSTSIVDVLRSIWSGISYIFIPIWQPFTRNIRSKNITGSPSSG